MTNRERIAYLIFVFDQRTPRRARRRADYLMCAELVLRALGEAEDQPGPTGLEPAWEPGQ